MKNALAKLMLRIAERTRTLPYVNLMVRITVSGSTVRLPLGGHRELSHLGIHEPHLFAVMRDVLSQRQGAVLDVGANIGQTLIKFLALRDVRPYVAFEPSLAAAWQVQRLSDANEASHVTVLPVALSDRTGVCEFSTSGPYDQAASLNPDLHVRGFFAASRYVPVLRGDDVVEALGLRPALIKIDAEGAEAAVLRGFSHTLTQYRPAVICEMMPFNEMAEEREVQQAEVRGHLESLGYSSRFIGGWEHLFQFEQQRRPQELRP